jgi:hypothetical protein
MGLIITALLMLAGFVLWWLAGLILAIRRRLSDRFANWLLPDGQPFTFRLGVELASLAAWLSPESILTYVGGESTYMFTADTRRLRGTLGIVRRPNTWHDAEAAIQELIADLHSGNQVAQPVRFTWPVFRIAAGLRLENALAVARFASARFRLSLWWVTMGSSGWIAAMGTPTVTAVVAVCVLFAGVVAEARYRCVRSASRPVPIGARARMRWLVPSLGMLLMAGVVARWQQEAALAEHDALTSLATVMALIASAGFSLGFLVDGYFTLPRVIVVNGRHKFNAAGTSQATLLTRVLLSRTFLSVLAYCLLAVAWCLGGFQLPASEDPLGSQLRAVILGGMIWPIIWVSAVAKLGSARAQFRYFLSPRFLVGDRIKIMSPPSQQSYFAGMPVGEILEAVDVRPSGILWMPLAESNDGLAPRSTSVLVNFWDLLTMDCPRIPAAAA